jgi:hypothetical protein
MIANKDTILSINNRILNEVCYDTINKLTDVNLLDEYKKCKSVVNKTNKLNVILNKYVSYIDRQKITSEYLFELIPAGTKGVIRGNKFNEIIKNKIEIMKLNLNRFEVCFEKACAKYKTTEKPDWYILEKSTNKIIVGMNSLDLWQGGQQLNRGYKYLIDNTFNTNKSKLLCVICNKITLKHVIIKYLNYFKLDLKIIHYVISII